jgi:hypothetical protein
MAAKTFLAAAVMVLAAAGSARADSASYTWTGMGTGVVGSSKCSTYRMTVDLTVDGKTVKGILHQQGRDERRFEAALDDKGLFKTKAQLGGGEALDVSGTIADKESRILLDGYCKFEGKLTRK